MNISTNKNSRDTPTSSTYPSSGKIGGGIIKLYQSRCFYIRHLFADLRRNHFCHKRGHGTRRVVFTGGNAFHGPYEHATVEGMDAAVGTLVGIVRRYAALKK